jgi:hypothetical protein
MVRRSDAGKTQLFKDQYSLLKSGIERFYQGDEVIAVDIAVRIRTLVHDTGASRAFLGTLNLNYRDLNIYRRIPPRPDAVFAAPSGFKLTGGELAPVNIRDTFSLEQHELVTLEQWWADEYLLIGTIRSSKRQVVLDVANKDGGAHVDPDVPRRHVIASEPPFLIGVTKDNLVRPNFARLTVAQAGNELLDYLYRHFAKYLA